MHLWLKALHLIAMVAWFAALFYMFRLFVYHAENRDRPEVTAVLKVMALITFFAFLIAFCAPAAATVLNAASGAGAGHAG